MIKRIAALIFIFACTSMAWFILGGTIFARSESQGPQLRGSVASTWGGAQEQTPPAASYPVTRDHVIYSHLADGTQTSRTEKETVPQPLPLDSTDARVNLQLEHRQKGLLWYSTYKVSFDATYSFTNPTQEPQVLTFRFSFPSEKAIYDDFVMTVNGTPLAFRTAGSTTIASTLVAAGQPAELRIAYRSQGMDSWHYNFGKDVTSVRNFRLQMTTNFHEISFEDNTLSPTDKQRTASGYLLTWAYSNLLSGFQIGVPMPEKLQPGPLAGEISLFAPVSLFFFFFIMFIITTMRNIEMHPMNYFFLATAFFAFHLLLAYLVDHISLNLAFAICAAVSVFLVVSYLRLVVGLRFALTEAAGAQFIYLVLFSYAFFFKGFTGLTVTIGSILTLFVVMQATGRVCWAEKFAKS